MILLCEDTTTSEYFDSIVGVTQFIFFVVELLLLLLFTIARLFGWFDHNEIRGIEDGISIIIPSLGNGLYFVTIVVFSFTQKTGHILCINNVIVCCAIGAVLGICCCWWGLLRLVVQAFL